MDATDRDEGFLGAIGIKPVVEEEGEDEAVEDIYDNSSISLQATRVLRERSKKRRLTYSWRN